MSKLGITPLALTVAACLATADARALGNGSGAGAPAASATGSPAMPLAKADRDFVRKAAIGGTEEVVLGELAQQNGASEHVKQFGAGMVQDYGKANEELKQIASSKGIDVPAGLDASHQKDVDKFSKLIGADFDRQYMKNMVADHKKDIADFKKAAGSAKDSEIKAFAGKLLPTLQEHLQMAQSGASATKNMK